MLPETREGPPGGLSLCRSCQSLNQVPQHHPHSQGPEQSGPPDQAGQSCQQHAAGDRNPVQVEALHLGRVLEHRIAEAAQQALQVLIGAYGYERSSAKVALGALVDARYQG